MKIMPELEDDRMKNNIRTSKRVAKLASKQLKNKRTSKSAKRVAGSALSNRRK